LLSPSERLDYKRHKTSEDVYELEKIDARGIKEVYQVHLYVIQRNRDR